MATRKPSTAIAVKPVNAEVLPTPLSGCSFAYDNGQVCLDTKLFSRGFCVKHYQQLRRQGAFQPKPRADIVEVLGNINSDRLDKARSILDRATPLLARKVIHAAKLSADKGDSKSAQWVLLHTRVVSPPLYPKNQDTPPGAPVINIGLQIAGLSPNTNRE